MIGNMRDLGGIRTADGSVIRKGMLIRSAQLADAEEDDLKGISSVLDLRTPGERREGPDRTHGREYILLPVFEDVTAGISHEEGVNDRGIPDMAVLYRRLVKERKDSFRKILLAIMQHDFSGGAILWHCSEGKDRCGITSALVLEALGADRDTIMADYLKTNEVNLPKAAAIRERLAATQGEEFADDVYRAYIADEKYLQAAWEGMGENYLRDALGITDEMIGAFRKTVL